MKKLSARERGKESRIRQATLGDRLDALAAERERVQEDIKVLGDEVAGGVAGARQKALNRADDLRALDIETEAVRRQLAAEEAEYQAEGPARDAEAAAERRTRCLAAIDIALSQARTVDEKARELVTAILEHQASLHAPVAEGVDPHTTHQLLPQYWFDHVLVEAGANMFRPDLQRNPNGANSLEEYTRAHLRV
jgi:hypothetical protein